MKRLESDSRKPEKRKVLRACLAALGLSLMPLKGDDGQNIDEAYANLPGQKNTQIDTRQTEELSDRISMPDRFDKEVQMYAEAIDDSDLKKTKEFADRPVVGAEEMTREEYVGEAILFQEWNEEDGSGVPSIVQEELRRILPGLCAQESRFNADSVSGANAMSIFQILPENWERYGGRPGMEKSLVAQVEVAGRLLSDFYKQLNDRIGEHNLNILKSSAGSEDKFYREVMVSLLVNSYNVGVGRMVNAVNHYLENTKADELPEGRYLYLAIADSAFNANEGNLKEYREHSRQYVSKVHAFADKLKEDNNKG